MNFSCCLPASSLPEPEPVSQTQNRASALGRRDHLISALCEHKCPLPLFIVAQLGPWRTAEFSLCFHRRRDYFSGIQRICLVPARGPSSAISDGTSAQQPRGRCGELLWHLAELAVFLGNLAEGGARGELAGGGNSAGDLRSSISHCEIRLPNVIPHACVRILM